LVNHLINVSVDSLPVTNNSFHHFIFKVFFIKSTNFFIFRVLDSSLQESVSSLLWVAPHIQADVSEMKVISDQLTQKFGKKYTEVNIVLYTIIINFDELLY